MNIRLNLLPYREQLRLERKKKFQQTMLASLMGGLAIAALVHLWFQSRIDEQNDRNQLLQSQIGKLNEQIREIAGLEEEIEMLSARQKAVENLQADRNLPVHLLNALVELLPSGVYISEVRQQGLRVQLKGSAQSNERVSQVLRNLGNDSPWITKPQLQEIVSGTLEISPQERRKVVNFVMTFNLVRGTAEQKE